VKGKVEKKGLNRTKLKGCIKTLSSFLTSWIKKDIGNHDSLWLKDIEWPLLLISSFLTLIQFYWTNLQWVELLPQFIRCETLLGRGEHPRIYEHLDE
jgi:hypothetical protein